MERKLCQELSRYYPLAQGQKAWKRTRLLFAGKHIQCAYDTQFTQALLSVERSRGSPTSPMRHLSGFRRYGGYRRPRRYLRGSELPHYTSQSRIQTYFLGCPFSDCVSL